MGTSVEPIIRHDIPFIGRPFEEVVAHFTEVLNGIKFTRADFLHDYVLTIHGSNEYIVDKLFRSIPWQINEQADFEHERQYFEEEHFFYLDGPYDLEIGINPYWIHPILGDRYNLFIGSDYPDYWENYVKPWRITLFQLAQAFGGYSVIYLADNGHPLEKYSIEPVSFEDTKSALYQEYGMPLPNRLDIDDYYKTSYYIDYFHDL